MIGRVGHQSNHCSPSTNREFNDSFPGINGHAPR
jgi:hypothetical protein